MGRRREGLVVVALTLLCCVAAATIPLPSSHHRNETMYLHEEMEERKGERAAHRKDEAPSGFGTLKEGEGGSIGGRRLAALQKTPTSKNVARTNRRALMSSADTATFAQVPSPMAGNMAKLVDGSTTSCLDVDIPDDKTMYISIHLDASYLLDQINVFFPSKSKDQSNPYHSLYAGDFPGTSSPVYGAALTCTASYSLCDLVNWSQEDEQVAEYVTVSSFTSGESKRRRRMTSSEDHQQPPSTRQSSSGWSEESDEEGAMLEVGDFTQDMRQRALKSKESEYLCELGACTSKNSVKRDSSHYAVCEIQAWARFCDAGYYYDESTEKCIQAAKGKYSPGGHINSDAKEEINCPVGKYGNAFGLSSSSCTGTCAEGYLCPAGSTSATQAPCTGATHYCTGGIAVQVSTGYYSTPTSNPATRRTGEQIADKGKYAVGGVLHDCPAGRYGALLGATSSDCSGPCEAGYYCPAGSTSPTPKATECSGPVYCPEGSANETPVSVGHLTKNANGDESFNVLVARPTTQIPCIEGSYCVGGIRRRCPGGTRNPDTLGDSESDCIACEAGTYCPPGSSLALLCTAGHYCEASSSVQKKCPAGRYRDASNGKSVNDCSLCPENTFSSGEGATSSESCTDCTYPETSPEGSSACFPALEEVIAEDTGKVEAGISSLDEIAFHFTSETNNPLAATKENIDDFITFSTPPGADYTGVWSEDGKTLIVTLRDTTGVDIALTAVGTLTAKVEAGKVGAPVASGLEVANAPASFTIAVTGSWGESSQPSLSALTALPLLSHKAGTGVPFTGDALLAEFDQLVKQVDVSSKEKIDNLLSCSHSFGSSYSASWISGTDLLITVTSQLSFSARPSWADVYNLSPGRFNCSVNPLAGLTSLDGASAACNSSEVVLRGTWGLGMVPPPILESHSPSSLLLRWETPRALAAQLQRQATHASRVGSAVSMTLSGYHVYWCGRNSSMRSSVILDDGGVGTDDSVCASAFVASTASPPRFLPILPLELNGDEIGVDVGVSVAPVVTIRTSSSPLLAAMSDDVSSSTSSLPSEERRWLLREVPAISLEEDWSFVGPAPSFLEGPMQDCECRIRAPLDDERWIGDAQQLLSGYSLGDACDPRTLSNSVPGNSYWSQRDFCVCSSSASLETARSSSDVLSFDTTLWGSPCGSEAVVPLTPSLTSVDLASSLATNGGERFFLSGKGLGTTVPEVQGEGGGSLLSTEDAEPRLRSILSSALSAFSSFSNPATSTPAVVARSTASIPYLMVEYGHDAPFLFMASECEVVNAQTLLRCVSADGVGADLPLQLHLNGHRVVHNPLNGGMSGALGVSYAPPVVTGFFGPGSIGANTGGGELIGISGRMFGSVDLQAIDSVTYNATGSDGSQVRFEAQNCSITVTHVEIQCLTAPGAGTKLEWRVRIHGQDSVLPFSSFEPPRLISATPFDPSSSLYSSLPSPLVEQDGVAYGGDDAYWGSEFVSLLSVDELNTRGGELVDIEGTGLGPTIAFVEKVEMVHSTTGEVLLVWDGIGATSNTSKTCTMVAEHRVLRCATPPGAGEGWSVKVTVLGQESVLDGSEPQFSYGPPKIVSIAPTSVPTEGLPGAELIITATNLPPIGWAMEGSQLKVSFFNKQQTVRVVEEYTKVAFTPSPLDIVLGSSIHTGPCVGAAGNQLRASLAVRVGSKSVNRWVCIRPPTISTLDVDSSRRNETAASTAALHSLPNPGTHLLEIYGSSFGANRDAWTISLASGGECRILSEDELMHHLLNYNPATDLPHTSLFCWIDVRRDTLALEVDGGGTETQQSYDYDAIKTAPTVVTAEVVGNVIPWTDDSFTSTPLDSPTAPVELGIGSNALDPRGGSVLEIGGSNLASVGSIQLVVLQESNSSVTLPASQRERLLALDCPLLTRDDPLYLLDAITGDATLDESDGSPCPVEEGFDEKSRVAGVNSFVCRGATKVRCVAPPGMGSAFYIVARAGLTEGVSVTPLSRYRAPVISTVAPSILPTIGGPTVTIRGRNFGSSQLSPDKRAFSNAQAFLESALCSPILSWSNSEINCTAPPGASDDVVVKVSSGLQSGTITGVLSFSPPTISTAFVTYPSSLLERSRSTKSLALTTLSPSITKTLTIPSRGAVLTVLGRDFGPDAFIRPIPPPWMISRLGAESATAQIGTCVRTAWNHSAISCVLPAGAGANISLSLETGYRSSRLQYSLHYHGPRITSVLFDSLTTFSSSTSDRRTSSSGNNLRPTRGGFLVHVFGRSFGSSPRLSIDGAECQPAWGAWDPNAPGSMARLWGTKTAAIASGNKLGVPLPPSGTNSEWLEKKRDGEDEGDDDEDSSDLELYSDVLYAGHEQLSCIVPSGTGHEDSVEVVLDTAQSALGDVAPAPAGSTAAGAAWLAQAYDAGLATSMSGVIGYDPPKLEGSAPSYIRVGSDSSNTLTLDVQNSGASASVATVHHTNVTTLHRRKPEPLPTVTIDASGTVTKVSRGASLSSSENPLVATSLCSSLSVTEPHQEMECVVVGSDQLKVGLMHMLVSIDSQLALPRAVFALCPVGEYGQTGESCKPCPEGATCAGGFLDPLPTAGFFKLDRDIYTPCSPPAACPGFDAGDVEASFPFSSLPLGSSSAGLPSSSSPSSSSSSSTRLRLLQSGATDELSLNPATRRNLASSNASGGLDSTLGDRLLSSGARSVMRGLSDSEVNAMLPRLSTSDLVFVFGTKSSTARLWRSAHVVNALSMASQCDSAYTGERCAECAERHYRLNERCLPCPELAELYIVGFFVLLAILVSMGYYLNKKRVNLSAASLGWDFAQIVSIIAGMFQYPAELRPVLDAVSASNFNLQLLAPECTLKVSFRDKFFAVVALPPMIVALCLLILGMIIITNFIRSRYERFRASQSHSNNSTIADGKEAKKSGDGFTVDNPVLRRKSSADEESGEKQQGAKVAGEEDVQETEESSASDVLVGLCITLAYFCYIQVVRNALSVMDCIRAVRPGDGKEISVLEIEPAILCDNSDPVYRELLPWGIFSGIVYGLGIPIAFAVILYVYRERIRADQALRERGEGGSYATNPNFSIRKRFERLYSDFRSETYYWRLILLARKMLIVVVSVLASSYPLFQASTAILVLFASFYWQVRLEPFLEAPPISKHFLALSEPTKKKRQEEKGVKGGKEGEESKGGDEKETDENGSSSASAASPGWATFVRILRTVSPAAVVLLREVVEDDGRKRKDKLGVVETGGKMMSRGMKRKSIAIAKQERDILERDRKRTELVELSKQARDGAAAYVFEYNRLERSFLVTSIILLAGGMIFASSALEKGSFAYVLLAIVLGFLLISSILTFMFLLMAELYRSLRFATVYEKARAYEEQVRRELVATVRAVSLLDTAFADSDSEEEFDSSSTPAAHPPSPLMSSSLPTSPSPHATSTPTQSRWRLAAASAAALASGSRARTVEDGEDEVEGGEGAGRRKGRVSVFDIARVASFTAKREKEKGATRNPLRQLKRTRSTTPGSPGGAGSSSSRRGLLAHSSFRSGITALHTPSPSFKSMRKLSLGSEGGDGGGEGSGVE